MKKIIITILTVIFATVIIISVPAKGSKPEQPKKAPQLIQREYQFDYRIDQEIICALEAAEEEARKYASVQLDGWIFDMMAHTDTMLDEYFTLFNVKKREASSLWHSLKHKVDKKSPSASDVMRKDFMDKFEAKVMNSSDAQQIIEAIADRTVEVFAASFGRGLAQVQADYNVPKLDWEKHINSLCGIASEYESRSVSVVAKCAYAGFAACNIAVPGAVMTKFGKKVAQKVAAKAGTRACTAGAATAAKCIPVIGAVVTVGMVGWDLYDTSKTAERNKRDIRAGFQQYFSEMKANLLGPTRGSIMGSIVLWSQEVISRIETQ